jgi:hypothetical protein
MEIRIKKGNHYPFPNFAIGLPKWIKKHNETIMTRAYWFNESCLYDLKDEDQGDVNKLFGFSIGLHHNTSFRFGWRADLKTRTIEIVGYEYHNKIRKPTTHICNIELREEVYFLIYYMPEGKVGYIVYQDNTHYNKLLEPLNDYVIRINVENTVNIKRKWGLGYTLGVYFGGNETAPQDITIHRVKIKIMPE